MRLSLMSGISAVIGDTAAEIIKGVSEKLKHRGPDEVSFFICENLALGQNNFTSKKGHVSTKLVSNEDNSIWISFDGEIYNKNVLIQQLERNHKFKSNSSAEIIIHAYEKYGLKCLTKFNGAFAFILWDSNNKLIFSARDRLGEKPLYYCVLKEHIVLSSEIKGILGDPLVPKKPNEKFIYEYLVSGYPSQVGNTFFKEIKELAPAHYLLIKNDNNVSVHQYWQPINHSENVSSALNDQEYASEFFNLLQDSIRIRLPTDSSIGTFMSGGIDSISIAFIVESILKSTKYFNPKDLEEQKIFSAIFDEPTEQGIEKHYIKHVEHILKKNVNFVFPSVNLSWEKIKEFIYQMEEPVAVFNYYVFWCLFQTAKQDVKIVFNGQGCDAILGGQNDHVIMYYKELFKNKKIGKLVNELTKSFDWIFPWLIWSTMLKRNSESKANMLLSKQFVASCTDLKKSKKNYTLQDALLSDVTKHAIEYLRVDDRLSSVLGMQCRHPFLDYRLVEFAFSLPASQKIQDGWTKYVFRNAVSGLIPNAIIKNKKKSATSIPQKRWMTQLQKEIRALFESDTFKKRNLFNKSMILNVFDRYCEGKLSRIERQYYRDMLWRIVNLELWFEVFFDLD